MEKNLTNDFVEKVYNLCKEDFSEDLKLHAKRCLLDYLGATLAGAYMIQDKGNRFIDSIGEENGKSKVIGFSRKSGIENAVFLNGLSAHVAELDDGVISGIVHPGSPIFSVLLPIAEREKVSGKDFINGVIVGYETSVRISDAIQPSHKKLGYHGTGTCGAIGAALGVSAMLGFSKKEIKDTLSAVSVSAAGMLKVLEDSSELKPFNVGRAAQAALISANLAKAGFQGPDDVLGGKTGFISMMATEYDESMLTKELDLYSIERVYFKPYAACRYCHPSIDATLEAIEKYKFTSEDIESVNVETYYWAVAKHDHTEIPGISSAKMSIPFSIAVALVTGKAGIEEFTMERILDKEISGLAKKVSVSANESLTELFPEKSPAIVKFILKDGRKFIEEIDFPKGEPENPLTNIELEKKFKHLLNFTKKPEHESKEIIDIVWNLEEKLDQLYPLL